MHPDRDREMAIPRMFNSNTPFVIVTGGSELSFLGKEDGSQGREEEKDSLVQAIAPHLSRVMQHGTAKHVVTEGQEVSEENPCVSIVAQAEREDFQEFSPTNTQCPYSRSQLLEQHRSLSKETALVSDTEDEDFDVASKLPHYHLQRKQRRKARRQSQEDGEQPPIIRGLWVQEIDWLKSAYREMTSSAEIIPPPPQFTDSVSGPCSHGDLLSCVYEGCADVSPSEDQYRSVDPDHTSSTDDRGGSDSDCSLDQDSESICTHESESDSSCGVEDGVQGADFEARMSSLTFDLMHVSGFNSSSHAEWDSDSAGCVNSDSTYTSSTVDPPQCAFGFDDTSDVDTVLDVLRGRVTHIPKLFVSPSFRDLIKQTLSDWKTSRPVNEGLIFHHQLQPSSCQYREGEEYCVLHHIQSGSYGDVFCVRDKRTGFECAAKRIPLSRLSSEEVSTWIALNSPRVVELFGAVREGLNIVLFMDLKPACLAQLLKEMDSLPEDLALHYLHQSLGALEHLHHRKVLHLDVKVDNVLLSADCRDTFLCDFGLSETLDDSGWSTKAFRGESSAALPGTETHMAPEVARGDQLCAKADVWSSCCMLLHMLNGCHPWTRYYSHPLCLQIVNEPPPLWEVPSNCNNFTAKVFRAGLQKDPDRRASAKELRRKTTKALRAVGGLSPWSVKSACEKLYRGKNEDTPCSLSPGIPVTPTKPSSAVSAPTMYWVSPWRTTAVDEDSNDWKDGDSDSEDSDHSSDDLSSGVFSSCNSQTDGHLEWLASANQSSSYCFEGVDIWIENVQGECLRIRERRQVKVGHVAIGISDQISGKAFTLETLDRKMVSFEQEIKESCLWLRCVPAPDRCQRWRWRVRDGKLELRE
ncbi:mitogen-activated protein kinase kinase kinase 14 [Enoplosus armatus]|uniref:mitogen-activated protein kinase kinase kinase 14 n=1 Tax=Enoplosus armatus TaxID=215367 RepID=UPI003992ADD8